MNHILELGCSLDIEGCKVARSLVLGANQCSKLRGPNAKNEFGCAVGLAAFGIVTCGVHGSGTCVESLSTRVVLTTGMVRRSKLDRALGRLAGCLVHLRPKGCESRWIRIRRWDR
jgi:hypothetical protein